jgi:hypothetical protein
VKVLLDECIDWRLASDIVGHDVRTARQMQWTGIKNGELLALASVSFDVFVTVDRNLFFQQNVAALPIAVVVLQAKTNRLAASQAAGGEAACGDRNCAARRRDVRWWLAAAESAALMPV